MTDNPKLHLTDVRRITHLVRLLLVLIIVGILVGPSAILFFVPGKGALKVCLIMIFTLIFASATTICTKAKRHEMLAATATWVSFHSKWFSTCVLCTETVTTAALKANLPSHGYGSLCTKSFKLLSVISYKTTLENWFILTIYSCSRSPFSWGIVKSNYVV